MLRKEMANLGLERKCSYRVTHRTHKFLYASCSQCRAFLHYKLMEEDDKPLFIIFKYNNSHHHPVLPINATKRERIVHYLQNLSPDI